MQNFQKGFGEREPIVFLSKLEDVPGGGVINVADLAGDVVYEGTPVGIDSNGVYHIEKTAKSTAASSNSNKTYTVKKGHHFKVGDFITLGVGGVAYAITSISTNGSDATSDDIKVGTTIGAAVKGDVVIQANAQTAGTDSAYKYTPVGLVGTTFDVVQGANKTSDIVVRGSVNRVNVAVNDDIVNTLHLFLFV